MARYTQKSITELIENFYQENHRAPRMDEMNSQHGLPTMATFKKLTGTTPSQYLRGEHPELTAKRNPPKSGKRKDKETIVEEYRQFYEEHHRMPTAQDCKEKKLAFPLTFKRATGSSPWAYFRDEQINASKAEKKAASQGSTSFPLELLKRLGLSVNDVSLRTGIPAQRIQELLNQEPSEEFRQLYAVARALNVPMEVLQRGRE